MANIYLHKCRAAPAATVAAAGHGGAGRRQGKPACWTGGVFGVFWNRTFNFSLKSPVPGVRLSSYSVRCAGGIDRFPPMVARFRGAVVRFPNHPFRTFRPGYAAQVIGVNPLACDDASRRLLFALGFTRNGVVDNQRVAMREPRRFRHWPRFTQASLRRMRHHSLNSCCAGSWCVRIRGRAVSPSRRWGSPCPVAAQRTRAWEARREPMGEPATTRWEERRDILARREASGTSALRSCQGGLLACRSDHWGKAIPRPCRVMGAAISNDAAARSHR